jgi:hypothetical protein
VFTEVAFPEAELPTTNGGGDVVTGRSDRQF